MITYVRAKSIQMRNSFQLVVNAQAACDNIKRFEPELRRNAQLSEIMAYGRAWYACRAAAGGWALAPSKFVGYAENNAKSYLSNYQERDGRLTERVLSQWFEEIDVSAEVHAELLDTLRRLFANFDKSPNKLLRISVLKSDLGSMKSQMPSSKSQAKRMPASRITVNPEMCGGRPCIRGMRIRVSDILDLLAAGNDRATILRDYPYLENEDIDAVLEYASQAVSHRIIKAA